MWCDQALGTVRIGEGSVADRYPLLLTHGLHDHAHNVRINAAGKWLQSVDRGLPGLQGVKVAVAKTVAVQQVEIFMHLAMTEARRKCSIRHIAPGLAAVENVARRCLLV